MKRLRILDVVFWGFWLCVFFYAHGGPWLEVSLYRRGRSQKTRLTLWRRETVEMWWRLEAPVVGSLAPPLLGDVTLEAMTYLAETKRAPDGW